MKCVTSRPTFGASFSGKHYAPLLALLLLSCLLAAQTASRQLPDTTTALHRSEEGQFLDGSSRVLLGKSGKPPPPSQAGVGADQGVFGDAKSSSSMHTKTQVSNRCVFVLGTGRSGSTSLFDALNQLPNYFIRGEQHAAFWHLYKTWKNLKYAWERSGLRGRVEQLELEYGRTIGEHLGYDKVKKMYTELAVQEKQPLFNDLLTSRVVEAVQGFYTATYGYYGPDVVSGFKEIGFKAGRVFSEKSKYEDFVDLASFLRLLCLDVKLLLNTRASYSLEDNNKLLSMSNYAIHGNLNETVFELDLQLTHEWYDRYTAEHPDHAFRVLMEDMFDPKRNATLARNLLTFLGEDPEARISFTRMPTWSLSTKKRTRKMRPTAGQA